jgi:hypothetical protein
MPRVRYAISAGARSPKGDWSVLLRDAADGSVELTARRQTSCGGWVTLTLTGLRRTADGDDALHLTASDLDLNFACHRVRDQREAAAAFRQFANWILSGEPRLITVEPAVRGRPQPGRAGPRFDRRRRPA